MDEQPRSGLTIIQLMLLIAALGIVLTIAAWLWQGPDDVRQSDAAEQQLDAGAENQ